MDNSEFLTNVEAARLLRISHRSLDRWRMTGIGPRYSKVGARVLYKRDDLLKWIEDNARTSTTERRS